MRLRIGKTCTIIEGLNQKEIDIKEVAKTLKSKLACGGTVKDGKIELQGDHKGKVKKLLTAIGFAPNTIAT
ncbi:stress response translation initiation inhibitor YciH [Candidatus Woesearchaeota archaeon]|nr:stress response translation initiation inhibitor YciH [Candidatus Woesearchaeota archaeon]